MQFPHDEIQEIPEIEEFQTNNSARVVASEAMEAIWEEAEEYMEEVFRKASQRKLKAKLSEKINIQIQRPHDEQPVRFNYESVFKEGYESGSIKQTRSPSLKLDDFSKDGP